LRRDIHGVRQIVEPHFPLRQDDIQIDDDGHKIKSSTPAPREFSAPRQLTTR
jgi:hypothetical protein